MLTTVCKVILFYPVLQRYPKLLRLFYRTNVLNVNREKMIFSGYSQVYEKIKEIFCQYNKFLVRILPEQGDTKEPSKNENTLFSNANFEVGIYTNFY